MGGVSEEDSELPMDRYIQILQIALKTQPQQRRVHPIEGCNEGPNT
jgi:hypothetical protein